MVPSSSELLSIRIDGQAVKLLNEICELDKTTSAVAVERLIFKEGRERKLVAAGDPGLALVNLLDETAVFLRSLKSPGEDITLEWFQAIKADPRLLALHTAAVQPPNRKITAEKRRQYVHQRVGRFVKEYLQRVAGKEVLLPRDSDELIRSYTKLRKA